MEKVFKADHGLPSEDSGRSDPVVGGWRWTSRMRLGAHTAELGDWNPNEARPLYEVRVGPGRVGQAAVVADIWAY